MYHYVRELEHSRYPDIKGLAFENFKEQIKLLKKNYSIVSAYDLLQILYDGSPLPENAALLTFDDGYLDHFTYVFPVLDKEGISGCFFPPAKCVLERKVLSVNKIHFILASVPDKTLLVKYICDSIDSKNHAYNLPNSNFFLQELRKPNRFDTADVIFIKRTLQRDLPENFRDSLINQLFHKYVTVDETAFAEELYMTKEQITCLQRNGMYIGNHGYDHYWLNTLSQELLEQEINRSLQFLASIGSDTKKWIMCYPYGAYNDNMLKVLKKHNCSLGLTTEARVASWGQDNPLTLPRVDTNDITHLYTEK